MGMLLIARFNGTCSKCGGAVKKGEEIAYDKASRTTRCERCFDSGPDLGQLFDMAYEDQCAAACGLDGPDRGN